MNDEAIHAELRKINEALGYINGTMVGVHDRLEEMEGFDSRVRSIEMRTAKNGGYLKGVGAAVGFLFALVGALAAFTIL